MAAAQPRTERRAIEPLSTVRGGARARPVQRASAFRRCGRGLPLPPRAREPALRCEHQGHGNPDHRGPSRRSHRRGDRRPALAWRHRQAALLPPAWRAPAAHRACAVGLRARRRRASRSVHERPGHFAHLAPVRRRRRRADPGARAPDNHRGARHRRRARARRACGPVWWFPRRRARWRASVHLEHDTKDNDDGAPAACAARSATRFGAPPERRAWS